jgi:hypothetical protein
MQEPRNSVSITTVRRNLMLQTRRSETLNEAAEKMVEQYPNVRAEDVIAIFKAGAYWEIDKWTK